MPMVCSDGDCGICFSQEQPSQYETEHVSLLGVSVVGQRLPVVRANESRRTELPPQLNDARTQVEALEWEFECRADFRRE